MAAIAAAAHKLMRLIPRQRNINQTLSSTRTISTPSSSASTATHTTSSSHSEGVRIVSIDGLIGAGKSTLCDKLHAVGYPVAKEPLQEWTVAGHDLLKTFYDDPQRYAYLFQTHCLRSRVVQVRDGLASLSTHSNPAASKSPKLIDPTNNTAHAAISSAATTATSTPTQPPLFFMERGVSSDAVFAETQHRLGNLNAVEYASYRYQYEQARNDTPTLSGRIYVHTSVDSCAARILSRSRNGEGAIDRGYLKVLGAAHDEWLERERARGVPVLVLDGELDLRDDAIARQITQSIEEWAMSVHTRTC